MLVKRKIIEIDEEKCTGCGQCIVDCAESALRLVDGKARLMADKYCDGLGACLGGCPTGALRIVEREATEFDEEAVAELLGKQPRAAGAPSAHACPGAAAQVFAPSPCQTANQPVSLRPAGASGLSHWPVQIRLVAADAPFLANAELLVAADCVPVAYPGFHAELLAGRAVMLGCPKFDDPEGYVQKFAQVITQGRVKSLLVAIMEVPCCQGMAAILKRAVALAGRELPAQVVVIGTQGQVLSRRPL